MKIEQAKNIIESEISNLMIGLEIIYGLNIKGAKLTRKRNKYTIFENGVFVEKFGAAIPFIDLEIGD